MILLGLGAVVAVPSFYFLICSFVILVITSQSNDQSVNVPQCLYIITGEVIVIMLTFTLTGTSVPLHNTTLPAPIALHLSIGLDG